MSKVSVAELVAKARQEIENAKEIPESLKKTMETLLDVVVTLSNQLGLNSSNSSKPPSQDRNRKRNVSKASGRKRKRRPGGQDGHKGNRLKPVAEPTEIEEIKIDRKSLPPGKYTHIGYEARQVFDVVVSLHVKEYRAEIVKDQKGNQFVADFPPGITQTAQYASSVKATSVYLSQYQLIPYARVTDCFRDQFGLPISPGSAVNFNAEAYEKLAGFEEWAKQTLIASACNNADETGINIGGKGHWLHCVSNEVVTLFFPDEKRGQEAMDRMGILRDFKGVLVHDHWKPYFIYNCLHALCNAHHLRELERACEQDGQKWAKRMQKLLIEMKQDVEKAGGSLSTKKVERFRKRYRRLLAKAEVECPKSDSRAQSKSRNLLERLKEYETETLRFMEDEDVPFTNNRAENDQRMTKVQQKVSGCFRTIKGAKIFCRIRSYLLTCRKNGLAPTLALKLLFEGKLPAFIT